VAGARLAFDRDPAGYATKRDSDENTPQQLILRQANAIIGDAPRHAGPESPTEAQDRSAGRALYERLARATARIAPDQTGEPHA
jgi:hypothetical protein